MTILIVNEFGQTAVRESEFLPRIGDKIDLFYEPLPTVTGVVAWPSPERIKALGSTDYTVCAIVAVR